MKVSPIKFIHNDKLELLAVDFGHGGRAQHNNGIGWFKKAFGVISTLEGLDKYASQVCSNKLKYLNLDYKKEMYCILHFDTIGTSSDRRKHLPPWFVDMFQFKYSDKCRLGINAAWNEDEFIIIAHEKYKEDIETLYNAFRTKDILIGYNPADLVHNGDEYYEEILKFSIKSKVENLSAKISFDVNETGQTTYRHIQSLITAEDLIYEELFKNNETVDNKKIEKELMELSKKYLT